MFRRLPNSLPKDPVGPADMEKLGYFINEKDQIRMIRNPEQKFQYVINKNERVNEVNKEAMNICVRRIVADRLQKLGLDTVRLPIGAESNENHVPILVSKDILRKKRVVVLFGERIQDLGIFSYRTVGDRGINAGSAVDLCTAMLEGQKPASEQDRPGVILTNPGQILWYRGGTRAVTRVEWANLPRESAVHEPFRVDEVKNKIPGNRDHVEHVKYVFEHVLSGMTASNATFDIIGLEYTGTEVLKYLANNWSTWSSRISGICLGTPQHTVQDLISKGSDSENFADFIGKRCRAYFVSDSSLETLMTGRKEFGCNCYASGEQLYPENVVVEAWRSMLDWFNVIHASPGYEEVEIVFQEGGPATSDETISW